MQLTAADPVPARLKVLAEVICPHAPDALSEALFGAAEVYRQTPDNSEVTLLDAGVLNVQSVEVWYELTLEPTEDSDLFRIVAVFTIDGHLDQSFSVSLQLGALELISPVDQTHLNAVWPITRRQLVDPRKTDRIVRPVKLKLIPAAAQ